MDNVMHIMILNSHLVGTDGLLNDTTLRNGDFTLLLKENIKAVNFTGVSVS